jgi:hypothetical protein
MHLGSARKNSLIPIMKIVLESGAINAAYLLAYIIALKTGSHAKQIMHGIVGFDFVIATQSFTDIVSNQSTPLIGIIFSIIIIRSVLHYYYFICTRLTGCGHWFWSPELLWQQRQGATSQVLNSLPAALGSKCLRLSAHSTRRSSFRPPTASLPATRTMTSPSPATYSRMTLSILGISHVHARSCRLYP